VTAANQVPFARQRTPTEQRPTNGIFNNIGGFKSGQINRQDIKVPNQQFKGTLNIKKPVNIPKGGVPVNRDQGLK